MKRFKPQDVADAFRATGLQPMRNEFCEDGKACAIGALYCHYRGGVMSLENGTDDATIQKGLGLTDHYMTGFICGWDDSDAFSQGERMQYSSAEIAEREQGFSDGRAAYALVCRGESNP